MALPPKPDDADLGGVLSFWAVALVLSLVVGAGLSPALRGAAPGIDQLIAHVDTMAGVTSQFSALLTAVLLVHVTILAVKSATKRPRTLVAALLGSSAVLMLLVAQRARVPYGLFVTAILLSCACMAICATAIARPVRGVRTVVLLAAIGIAFETTHLHLERERLLPASSEALGMLGWLLGLAAGLVAAFRQYMVSRIGRWGLPVTLGLALLAALMIDSSQMTDVSTWLLVSGRALSELTPMVSTSIPAPARAFQLGLALCIMLWMLASRLSSQPDEPAQLMLAGVVALGAAVETSPQVIAGLTLASMSSVVIGARV